MTDFVAPGLPGSKVTYLSRYDHWINGKFVKPSSGQYFENVTPVTGKVFCDVARGNAADIDLALDAAHAAAPAWGRTSATERAIILNKIADRMEANVEAIAVAETWENGKPIREALYVDIPLAIDHFRYFAAAIRAQEGSAGELDHDTV
ncbi:MAG: aldehyde dehydrogenase family protein, partial [Actinobacteria bacterium]|nr:aldehyde dehydrogenase family protein [Actinomycetota bacterium]